MTGTFDDWKKTEKLEKVDGHFEKAVALKDASAKIYYKVRRISSRPKLVIFNCLIYPCFFSLHLYSLLGCHSRVDRKSTRLFSRSQDEWSALRNDSMLAAWDNIMPIIYAHSMS